MNRQDKNIFLKFIKNNFKNSERITKRRRRKNEDVLIFKTVEIKKKLFLFS